MLAYYLFGVGQRHPEADAGQFRPVGRSQYLLSLSWNRTRPQDRRWRRCGLPLRAREAHRGDDLPIASVTQRRAGRLHAHQDERSRSLPVVEIHRLDPIDRHGYVECSAVRYRVIRCGPQRGNPTGEIEHIIQTIARQHGQDRRIGSGEGISSGITCADVTPSRDTSGGSLAKLAATLDLNDTPELADQSLSL